MKVCISVQALSTWSFSGVARHGAGLLPATLEYDQGSSTKHKL